MDFLPIVLIFIGFSLVLCVLIVWVDRERKKNRYSPFTEKLLRSPSYSLSGELQERGDDLFPVLSVFVVIPMVFGLVQGRLTTLSWWVLAISAVVAICVALKKLTQLFDKMKVLRLGYDGEVYTGQELNYLMRSGAWVYHDIPYKYGNIDHVIVSTGGVFVVETKAYRKPASKSGRADANVEVIDGELKFPHARTRHPLEQAKRHAQYMLAHLQNRLGKTCKVTPVVALPGWFIKGSNANNEVLVINPKRGKMLKGVVNKEPISEQQAKRIAFSIEEFARDVHNGADRYDPDARNQFSFWMNRKHESRKL